MATGRDTPGYQALRRGRVSLCGQVYLLTFTTFRRRAMFRDPVRARIASAEISRSDLWADSRLLAWVLMPDHWHGLVELGAGVPLPDLMRRVKTNSSREIRRACFPHGRIWADGFHDRALREEDDLVGMARYVVLNPVRAGLVRSVWAYPFWDAIWVEGRGT